MLWGRASVTDECQSSHYSGLSLIFFPTCTASRRRARKTKTSEFDILISDSVFTFFFFVLLCTCRAICAFHWILVSARSERDENGLNKTHVQNGETERRRYGYDERREDRSASRMNPEHTHAFAATPTSTTPFLVSIQ